MSFLFFSPPEKPSFTDLLVKSDGSSTNADFSFILAKKSLADNGSKPLCSLISSKAAFKKLTLETPGISTGY